MGSDVVGAFPERVLDKAPNHLAQLGMGPNVLFIFQSETRLSVNDIAKIHAPWPRAETPVARPIKYPCSRIFEDAATWSGAVQRLV